MTKVPVYEWQPSTAEIARRAGIAIEDVVRFDHNTSPYSPPWAADAAQEAAAGLHEYPAADYTPLREAAAARAGVDAAQVVPGAGADELIILCATAFLEPGGTALADSPTYTLYRIATLRRGAEYRTVERPAPDFELPRAELGALAPEADVLWLCQPHNPSGRRDSDAAIAELIAAARNGVVVIDAAYAEFAGDRWAAWVERHENLVVLHTLSKGYGLGGIRVGYSLSSPELAARLHGVRPPGSLSTVSASLAARALTDADLPGLTVDAVADERSRLAKRLADLGLRVLPSDTNFLLCEVGPHALAVEQALMAEGLVVRSYKDGPLTEYLRFTVRTPGEDDRLVAALERNLP